MNNKNNELILCSGIKLDKDYENVLSYNEDSMVSLCRTNQIYTNNNYTIIQPNKIRVAASYSDCIFANYMAYKNPNFGNKWFFAWVTDVKLLNPATTEITFEVDVFSTWYQRFNLNQVFVEREHVTDDTIGKHTVPENLEIGDYVCDSIIKQKGMDRTGFYILASSFIPYLDANDNLIVSTSGDGGNVYNGIYNGLVYSAFSNSTAGITRLKKVLQAFAGAGRNDDINCIFMAPLLLQSYITYEINAVWGIVNSSFDAFEYAWESYNTGFIYKPSSLNGYTPVNKKLLTYPYCFFEMNNGNGGSAIYKYELFKNNLDNYCDFSISYSVCPGMSTILRPHFYESTTVEYNHKADLVGGKFPTCGWISDTYTNWLTQNAVNIKLGIVQNSFSVGTGVASQNPMAIAGGLFGIANSMAEIYKHREFSCPQAEGQVNTGDVNFSTSNTTFTCYKMSIKSEFASIIDKYFSRFGYKVNIVKTPSLTSRSQFNYIKVGGMDELVSGNIPARDLQKINEIFRKGTTVFHNYSNIGNYTISNPNA